MSEALQHSTILDHHGQPILRTPNQIAKMGKKRPKLHASASENPRDSAYRGARLSRNGWNPRRGRHDELALPERLELVARARDHERNSDYTQGIVRNIVEGSVGSGLTVEPTVDRDQLPGMSKEAHKEWQAACKSLFEDSCNYLDVTGRNDFVGATRQCSRRVFIDGDYLAQKVHVKGPMRPTNVAYEFLDTNRLSNPNNKAKRKSGSKKQIRMGVEVADDGARPVAYWIAHHAPGSRLFGANRLEWTRIRAENQFGHKNVLHVYDQIMPGQSRGVSALAPVMAALKYVDDILATNLFGMKRDASIGLIRKNDPQMAELEDYDPEDYDDEQIDEWFAVNDISLPPGQELTTLNLQRPGDQFEPFILRVLIGICSGVGIPLELLTCDYTKTNYSSSKAARADFLRYIRGQWRRLLVQQFCQPIYQAVIFDGWANGKLPQIDLLKHFDKLTRSTWNADSYDALDPRKEAEANRILITHGLKTFKEYCAENQMSWQEHLDQAVEERAYIVESAKQHGIPTPTLGEMFPLPPTPEDSDDEEEDEDDE